MVLSLEVRKQMKTNILKLAFELEKFYPSSNFKHHCYLRIAYDNTVHCKWQEKVKKLF